ncbi:hypothetical protein M0812_26050 [Anaeramoeba flamelloides]|uniref:Uncharacterized protein n=1 Tax=Anaeramoeba flamelloides TaxID=1746091 RepID=A0AAV7YF41_9EUKA|nr:hypothetical protein M0812_26050 [Anaeramoeba flamelloides]
MKENEELMNQVNKLSKKKDNGEKTNDKECGVLKQLGDKQENNKKGKKKEEKEGKGKKNNNNNDDENDETKISIQNDQPNSNKNNKLSTNNVDEEDWINIDETEYDII